MKRSENISVKKKDQHPDLGILNTGENKDFEWKGPMATLDPNTPKQQYFFASIPECSRFWKSI